MGMEQDIMDSFEAMHWLTDADIAMKSLALTYARELDMATASGSEELITARLWLGPQLMGVLKALGGTPAERKKIGVESQIQGKLAALKAARNP